MNKDDEVTHSIALGMNDPARGQSKEFGVNVGKIKKFASYCDEYKDLIADFDPYSDDREEEVPFVLEDHSKDDIIHMMKTTQNRIWLGMRCEIESLRKQLKTLKVEKSKD